MAICTKKRINADKHNVTLPEDDEMKRLFQMLSAVRNSRFVRETDGATAIEYALIAVGVSIVIITTVFLMGDELDLMFNEIRTEYLAQRGG